MKNMFISVSDHTVYAPPLGPKIVVVDVGANRGNFSREMNDRFGGTYLLVEPNPRLNEALRADGWQRVLPYAVAAENGTALFNIAHNDEGSSLLALPNISGMGCTLQEATEVPVRRLNDILAEAGPKVDLVKIDIEGAEVEVLQSISDSTLQQIGQLSIEFHCHPMFGFGMEEAVEGIIRRLQRERFLCLDFSGQNRLDVLCVNRNLHPIPWHRKTLLEMRFLPPRWVHRVRLLVPLGWRSRIREILGRSTREATKPGEPVLPP